MTSSTGTNLRNPSFPVSTKRGILEGTFTRANNSSLVSGFTTTTARFRDNPEMYGNGWEGSTARGVRTGKIFALNTLFTFSFSDASREAQLAISILYLASAGNISL